MSEQYLDMDERNAGGGDSVAHNMADSEATQDGQADLICKDRKQHSDISQLSKLFHDGFTSPGNVRTNSDAD